MKSQNSQHDLDAVVSPSMRREWIEIVKRLRLERSTASPSMRREWIEIMADVKTGKANSCLPPCGGSGLKYSMANGGFAEIVSPSMRREWIEMQSIADKLNAAGHVSLHAEGVD